MINLVLPLGGSHGWGVVGKYIAKELASLRPARLFSDAFSPESLSDDIAFAQLLSLIPSPEEIAAISTSRKVDGPLFCVVAGHEFRSLEPILQSDFKAGCVVFEENKLSDTQIENAKKNFDLIFTGSSWCTNLLRERGVSTAQTLIQGIDPVLFHPFETALAFPDKFVVFSGGKFEFRKGQDIVLRAFKVLQDRHDDVMLIAGWFNMWPYSVATMRMSSLIKFAPRTLDYVPMMQQILTDNGVDLDRTILLPLRANPMMPPIYRAADVGLFPNRCEGGTNLVMMEFMACGKPVIAADNFGHKDINTADNSILIKNSKPIAVNRDGQEIAVWEDPDLDETVEHLEWAYQNREKLKSIGSRAATDMTKWTWSRTAKQIHETLPQ